MEKRYPNKSHEQSVDNDGRVRLKHETYFNYETFKFIFVYREMYKSVHRMQSENKADREVRSRYMLNPCLESDQILSDLVIIIYRYIYVPIF
jgi:hypothetical protein